MCWSFAISGQFPREVGIPHLKLLHETVYLLFWKIPERMEFTKFLVMFWPEFCLKTSKFSWNVCDFFWFFSSFLSALRGQKFLIGNLNKKTVSFSFFDFGLFIWIFQCFLCFFYILPQESRGFVKTLAFCKKEFLHTERAKKATHMRVQIGNLSVLLGNNFVMDFLILHNFLNVTTADFFYAFFRPILIFFASKMSFSAIEFLKGIFPNPFVFCMRLRARTYVFMVDELRFCF